ncbi:hypothetical protein ABTM96_20135, partial [Acinetobacter baumannii]
SFFLLLIILSQQVIAQKTIVVKCGKLLDARTGNISTNQTILIKGNKIESIGTNTKADSVIDLSDYFVLPGLIDCHTHVLLQADIT